MYKVRYRIWDNFGLVCCEGEAGLFDDAFSRVETWLENNAVYMEIAKIEFERIDE